MKGDIVLDEDYDSGIEGSPGARFSIYLNRNPLVMDAASETAPLETDPSSLSPVVSTGGSGDDEEA